MDAAQFAAHLILGIDTNPKDGVPAEAQQKTSNNTKSRRQLADESITYVCAFLKEAGWTVSEYTMYHIDPVTKAQYPTDIAYCIQLGRDLTFKE